MLAQPLGELGVLGDEAFLVHRLAVAHWQRLRCDRLTRKLIEWAPRVRYITEDGPPAPAASRRNESGHAIDRARIRHPWADIPQPA